jgi:hypothetical protein
VLGGKAWGCPVAPAITTGAPWSEAAGPPDSSLVRAAIGALLNEGVLADHCLNGETLKRKWDKLARAPKELKQKKPEKAWPSAAPPTASKGSLFQLF